MFWKYTTYRIAVDILIGKVLPLHVEPSKLRPKHEISIISARHRHVIGMMSPLIGLSFCTIISGAKQVLEGGLLLLLFFEGDQLLRFQVSLLVSRLI